jgi:hypothetical protein
MSIDRPQDPSKDLPVISTEPNTSAAIDKTVARMIRDHDLPAAMRLTDLFDFVRMPQLTRHEWLVDGELTIIKPREQDRYAETAQFLRRWLLSTTNFAPSDLHTSAINTATAVASAPVGPTVELGRDRLEGDAFVPEFFQPSDFAVGGEDFVFGAHARELSPFSVKVL